MTKYRKGKYSKVGGVYRSGYKKGKYRQQKLAVATVEKIAKKVAIKEDNKNKQKYVHVTYINASGATWINPRMLPNVTDWKNVTGAGLDAVNGCESHILSDFGGKVKTTIQPELNNLQQGELEVSIHGIQCYGVVQQNSSRPCRIEVRLIYIPNINTYTVSSIDYLIPRLTMFYRSGKGCGNLLYKGYDRKHLGASDATGIPIGFTEYGRKVIHLPSAVESGLANEGTTQTTIKMNTPSVFKKFSITKYFKRPKKAFIRADNEQLTNGNYYLVYWSDLMGTNSFDILATTNLQYSIKQQMNNDDPTTA